MAKVDVGEVLNDNIIAPNMIHHFLLVRLVVVVEHMVSSTPAGPIKFAKQIQKQDQPSDHLVV